MSSLLVFRQSAFLKVQGQVEAEESLQSLSQALYLQVLKSREKGIITAYRQHMSSDVADHMRL